MTDRKRETSRKGRSPRRTRERKTIDKDRETIEIDGVVFSVSLACLMATRIFLSAGRSDASVDGVPRFVVRWCRVWRV